MKHIPKAFKSEHPSGTGLNGRTYTNINYDEAINCLFKHVRQQSRLIQVLKDELGVLKAVEVDNTATLDAFERDNKIQIERTIDNEARLAERVTDLETYKSNKLFKRKPVVA